MGVFCRAELNYSATSSAPATPVEVDVFDGRAADLPGWMVCGFELVHDPSCVRDWADDAEIAAVHHPEVEALARRLTGCDVAMVSNHIKRDPSASARHPDLGPIRFVHSDFARGHDDLTRRGFREARVDGEVPARHDAMGDLVDAARRIVVLQCWRNLGPAKMDLPLAWCDARTVDPAEARPFGVADYAGRGGHFEALAVAAPAAPDRHRWYTFPELTIDETVVFRTYDSDIVAAGGTYFTPHSAFRDPEVAVGQPARASIELRANCFFA